MLRRNTKHSQFAVELAPKLLLVQILIPIRNLIDSIEKSLKAEAYHCALFTSLMIPDICSASEGESRDRAVRYAEWFEKYMPSDYDKHVTGFDCYALRNSYIHEGSGSALRQMETGRVNEFYFIPKGSHLLSIGGLHVAGTKFTGQTVCVLSVVNFCEDMIKACDQWLRAKANDPKVDRFLCQMVKINRANTQIPGISIS